MQIFILVVALLIVFAFGYYSGKRNDKKIQKAQPKPKHPEKLRRANLRRVK